MIRKRYGEQKWGYVMDDYSGERKRFATRADAASYMRLSFAWSRGIQTHVIEEGKSK